MNNEEFKTMVNQGVQRTIAQGKPCVNDEGHCKYDLDGSRCVVGHMMTEEEHGKFKENSFGVRRLVDDAGWKPELSRKQIKILSDIQYIHDDLRSYEGEDFTQRFQCAVSEINLDN
tara:strand:- start:12 stop:359 length:348 start_codon:yes stop_codon:yes gene_type:complete